MDFRDLMLWRWPPRPDSAGQADEAEPLRALQADINRAFEDFWRSMPAPSFHANWAMTVQPGEPRIDLIETDREIEISAEVPGLNERDIEVMVNEDCLTIKANKSATRDRQGGGYRINERLYGAVQRTIPLPAPVDQDGVRASYRNGVLTINVPKKIEPQENIRHIPVNKS